MHIKNSWVKINWWGFFFYTNKVVELYRYQLYRYRKFSNIYIVLNIFVHIALPYLIHIEITKSILSPNPAAVIWYLYGLEVGEQQVLVTLFSQHGFLLSTESTLCLSQHVSLFCQVLHTHLQTEAGYWQNDKGDKSAHETTNMTMNLIQIQRIIYVIFCSCSHQERLFLFCLVQTQKYTWLEF